MRLVNLLSLTSRSITLLIQISVVVLASTQRAGAQYAGDTGAGRELAKIWCDSCHMVDPAQRRGVSNGAPPFTAIADMKSTTFMSLAAFLQTPHNRGIM